MGSALGVMLLGWMGGGMYGWGVTPVGAVTVDVTDGVISVVV
jgi:hypothetical protein